MTERTPLETGLECLKANKVDEAIEHLERATSEHGQDYRGFNFLGIAYAKKGLYDRAIGAFERTIDLRSDIPSTHYNLGLAYQADDFPDRAREKYQQALGLDPSYQKAVEALKALDAEQQADDSLAAQACARHTDEPAMGICSFCRLPVCQKCKTIVDDKVYCTTCAENEKRG